MRMLEKPDLPDACLPACVQDAYGLRAERLDFLPLGADRDTAVYRLEAHDAQTYFLKLRRGALDEASIRVPRFLRDQGIAQVMAPIATAAGDLWTRLHPYTVTLYPFVEGHSGFARPLTDRQWFELGAGLKRLHATMLPDDIARAVPRESYRSRWPDRVRAFQARIASDSFRDPVAARLAAFLHERRDEIAQFVERAEQLSVVLRARPPAHVLCHADLHADNVLVDAHGALSIVDWDTLIFAPKERDLMFIGGGVGGIWNSAREVDRFYRGYGETPIDAVALVYYRYARIVEDIAVYCEELLDTEAGGADRQTGLRSVMAAFLPQGVAEIARETDQRLLGREDGGLRGQGLCASGGQGADRKHKTLLG
jgi:spectinomycin phosphotransferase